MDSTRCWCGATHPTEPADLTAAWEALWHQFAGLVRLPEIVRWLNDRLERRS